MQVKIDTTKSPIDSWYIKSIGTGIHIVYEYDNDRADSIITVEQFNSLFDSILKELGKKTYSELEKQLEERNNFIGRNEILEDARMERYFNSDCIL